MRILGVVVAGFCAFLQLYSTQPLLPRLSEVFDAGSVTVSLTVTVAALGVALAAPFAGLLADRFGRKRVIVASAFLLAITSFAAATSPNLATLIFWRFCQGAFTPGVFSVTVAYINDEWTTTEIPRALSAYVSGTVVGGFSCRFISGIVASRFDWRTAFIVLGIVNLICAAIVARLLAPEARDHAPLPINRFAHTIGEHLRNRRLLATYLVGFCVLFSLVGVFTYVTFYLAAPPFHLEPAALGSIFLVYLIGAAINPIAGRGIARFGHRAVLATGVSAGIAGVSLTFVQNLWAVGLGLTLCCSGVFAAQTASNGHLGIATDRYRGLAVGLYATFYYLGGGAGGVIPGYFWNWGGWPACAGFIAAVQLLTVTLALILWDKPRVPPKTGFIPAPELD